VWQISALVPGLEFKPVVAQRLQCRHRDSALVLNAAAAAEAVRRQPASLVAAVMERHSVEVEQWEIRYLVHAQHPQLGTSWP
jgi:hypothetical protein